jgi:hypothetical protein
VGKANVVARMPVRVNAESASNVQLAIAHLGYEPADPPALRLRDLEGRQSYTVHECIGLVFTCVKCMFFTILLLNWQRGFWHAR